MAFSARKGGRIDQPLRIPPVRSDWKRSSLRMASFPDEGILVRGVLGGWIRKSTRGLRGGFRMENRVMVRKSKMTGEQRLLNANEAAKYLSLSYWTLRDLIWSGAIPLVQLPNKNGGRLRRILVDKNDLDRLIEQSKETE
jgi:excisionase family DNA binding protein